jgi:hypothetical protein
MKYIFLYDYLLFPIYFCVILLFAKMYARKKYGQSPLAKYFMRGLLVKIIGGFCFAMVYQYYYNGGDTTGYYWCAKAFSICLFDNPHIFWHQFTTSVGIDSFNQYLYAASDFKYPVVMREDNATLMAKIMFPLSVITFNSYLCMTLFLSTISFYGCWKFFTLFIELKPELTPKIALFFLYWPSTAFWGSAINKDTFCLAALGVLTYSWYYLFIHKKLKMIVPIAICIYLIFIIKVYIIMAFLPAGFFWILLIYKNKIENRIVRVTLTPFIVSVFLVLSYLALDSISEMFARYSMENILSTMKNTGDYISSIENSSAYKLGDFDPTDPTSIVKLIPAAINVTLFRPYVWESTKPIILISAIESLFMLVFTILAFFRTKLINGLKLIYYDPFLVCCFIFSIVFSFAIGISTLNFGTLVRYKIPALPFFVFMILSVFYSKKNKPKIVVP